MVRSHRGWTIPPGCGRAVLGGGFHLGQGGSLGRRGGEMVSPWAQCPSLREGHCVFQRDLRRGFLKSGAFFSRSSLPGIGSYGPHHDLVGCCAGPVAGHHRPGNRPLVRYHERPFPCGVGRDLLPVPPDTHRYRARHQPGHGNFLPNFGPGWLHVQADRRTQPVPGERRRIRL